MVTMRMGILDSFANDDARRVKNDLRDAGDILDGVPGQTAAGDNYQTRLTSPVIR